MGGLCYGGYELRAEHAAATLEARRSVNAPRLQIILINGLTMVRERYNCTLFIVVRANGTLLLKLLEISFCGNE